MKQKFLAFFATAVLLLSVGACSDSSDNPSSPSQQEIEQSLVGLWYESFDYQGVTEADKPFNRALIVVETKADHTGYCLTTNSMSRSRSTAVRMMRRSRGRSQPKERSP